MTKYTPTTEEVRSLYKSGAWLMTDRAPNKFDQGEYEDVLFGEFDRWLNEIRAEAWEEGFDAAVQDWAHHDTAGWGDEDCADSTYNPYRKNEK